MVFSNYKEIINKKIPFNYIGTSHFGRTSILKYMRLNDVWVSALYIYGKDN